MATVTASATALAQAIHRSEWKRTTDVPLTRDELPRLTSWKAANDSRSSLPTLPTLSPEICWKHENRAESPNSRRTSTTPEPP